MSFKTACENWWVVGLAKGSTKYSSTFNDPTLSGSHATGLLDLLVSNRKELIFTVREVIQNPQTVDRHRA